MQSYRCALFLLSAILSQAEIEQVPVHDLVSAVLSNDECTGTEGANCAFNALQLQSVEKDMPDKAIDMEAKEAPCKACNNVCQDYTTYGHLAQCSISSACRVQDVGDYGGKPGSAVYCGCADTSCDVYINLKLEDFVSMKENDSAPIRLRRRLSGHRHRRRHSRRSSCAAYGCGGSYRQSHSCQCNAGCTRHGNCCHDYWQKCSRRQRPAPQPAPKPVPQPAPQPSGQRVMKKLYHTTSRDIAELIVKGDFKKGAEGWCGGAIYFMDYPGLPRSKHNPLTSHDGAIIEANVDVGKVCHSTRNPTCWESQQGTCCPMPGGGHGTAGAAAAGCGSILWNPGDGNEWIIWDTSRIVSKKIL